MKEVAKYGQNWRFNFICTSAGFLTCKNETYYDPISFRGAWNKSKCFSVTSVHGRYGGCIQQLLHAIKSLFS